MSITPMTRVELFLAAIAGEEYTAPDPMTRIEVYLDDILKGNVSTLEPMTRVETYLAKISGADVDIPPYPMTRIEMFLAALCDEDITPPAAMTRIELYLANWIENAGTDVTNTAPYLFRSLPYNAKKKTLNKIVGGTVAWNQLQENGNFESTSNIEAYYGTISASNGVLSYTVSSVALDEWSSQIRMPSVSCVDGHKHLITFAIKPAHSKTNQAIAFLLRTSGSGPNIGFGRFNLVGGEWNRIGYIANVNAPGTTYGTLQILFNATSGNGYSVGDVDQVKDVMCIDLTRLFGSTIADYIYGLGNTDGVAFFKNLFPKDYYPYDAGSIVSVKTSASTMKNADESASSSYALSNTELRGIPKLDASNNLYYDGDEYTPDGTVKRKYEYRAYASGDESLADAITDGTHTVAKLTTPTTETTTGYTAKQTCYPNGTEEFVDGRTVEVPVGHETVYKAKENT